MQITVRGKLLFTFSFLLVPVLCEDWKPRLAAEYLDSRQKEWFDWKRAAVPGGPCVSCHTGATYLLARPSLRKVLGEKEPTTYETGLLNALRARVEKREAREIFPGIKAEPTASQAVGVEAIHAALFLALENSGKAMLSADAQQAFDRLWSLQVQDGKNKGAWAWFSLGADPYEMPESNFYGAALAAMAVANTPESYRNSPEIRAHVTELITYLNREQPSQPLHNRLMLLWATANLPGALPDSSRKAIIDETWKIQQADGGWTIESMGPWKPHASAPVSSGSNSYATAVAAVTLKKAGIAHSDRKLKRALKWLRTHQSPQSGYWAAQSMNKVRDPESMEGQFMRDAATAFAVLALVEDDEPVRTSRKK